MNKQFKRNKLRCACRKSCFFFFYKSTACIDHIGKHMWDLMLLAHLLFLAVVLFLLYLFSELFKNIDYFSGTFSKAFLFKVNLQSYGMDFHKQLSSNQLELRKCNASFLWYVLDCYWFFLEYTMYVFPCCICLFVCDICFVQIFICFCYQASFIELKLFSFSFLFCCCISQILNLNVIETCLDHNIFLIMKWMPMTENWFILR